VSGITLSYRDGVGGSDSILLLHGLNAHSGTWRNNVPYFSEEMRVLAPSLPFWRGNPRDLDILAYVRYVRQFLEVLKVKRVNIAGNSMGGWIAMKIAEYWPDLVEALVLEDAAGLSTKKEPVNPERISEMEIPVLIIWGEDDRTIPLSDATKLHSEIRGSVLKIFDHTGHVPHWERPLEFNQQVLDFLRKVRETQSR
jgi:abhydrolase domain-containing protein 6